MEVRKLPIPDVLVLKPKRFEDDRGWFFESYNKDSISRHGIQVDFVQDNHSFSVKAGTVRGLHYQAPPFAQAKLVRVTQGRIYDVAVDVRLGSPTFGQYVGVELTSNGGEQIFVPSGFLHGFITLEDSTHVLYKVDNFYSKECDGAVRFDDPELGIDWGALASHAVLSNKDQQAESWASFKSPFSYSD